MITYIRNICRWVEQALVPDPTAPRVEVVEQYTIQSQGVRRGQRSVLVNRVPRPYWEERGWQKVGGKYEGMYQTRFGHWFGYVTVSPSGRVEVFIRNPPACLEKHPHWACFNKRLDGWYFIHPIKSIADVSAGIINVEKTITEAYED